MTYKELEKDLKIKCSSCYFEEKLFEDDEKVYYRRSFDDLFKYYSQFDITEKLLLKALYECGFSAAVCDDIYKVVFFKYYPQAKTFWMNKKHQYGGYCINQITKNTKYTAEYLDKLFETI